MFANYTSAFTRVTSRPKFTVMADATRHNSESIFFRLPGEMRNEIYAYVFTRRWYLPTHNPEYAYALDHPGLPSRIQPKDGLPLTRTCRQMYHETRLLPFKHMVFNFDPIRMMIVDIPHSLACAPNTLRKLSIVIRLEIELNLRDDSWGRTVVSQSQLDDVTGLVHTVNRVVLPQLEHVQLVIVPEIYNQFAGVVYGDSDQKELEEAAKVKIETIVEMAKAEWQAVNTNAVLEVAVDYEAKEKTLQSAEEIWDV